MKTLKRLSLVAMAACLLAANAWADRPGRPYGGGHPHGSVQFGIHIGAPLIYPPYYPYPVYWPRIYIPPVAPVVMAPPPVYVEQQSASAAAVPTLEPGYWYYCNEAQAYFPYVKQCPGSWQKVTPQPSQ